MKDYLQEKFEEAAAKLDYLDYSRVVFNIPANPEHGDYSTNIAMISAKSAKKNPRQIAQEIIDSLQLDEKIITKVEIAGPGFINFYFNPASITSVIERVFEQKESFGKSKKYSGKKAILEFVSANPTGPLTVGHGRNAVIGDTLSNMLEWSGYEVDREYYFNNAGRQMRVLGDSLRLRYLQLFDENIDFPEDYYQGEYLIDIAKSVQKKYGDGLKAESAEGKFKEIAEKEIFSDIERTLDRIQIKFKNFYNEQTLYEDGKIQAVLDEFKSRNLSYQQDNATWLKLTEMGQEVDKVIIKSTGEPTYRLPDIAYHRTKFDRGYDLIIDLFGSDHAATYPDVLASIKALGYDLDKIKVLIHQFVTILEKGEVVKMSTRKANFITLDELIDEVGADVVRYFFIMRNISSHLNFDIDIAKKQSDENPVFYLQYAHARICSILRMVVEQDLKISTENLELLVHPAEQNLLKMLHQFEEEVLSSAESFEPQRISNYLEELAAKFHKFYTDCRIMGTEKLLAEARIALAEATKIVLKNGLTILGLSAPEKM